MYAVQLGKNSVNMNVSCTSQTVINTLPKIVRDDIQK